MKRNRWQPNPDRARLAASLGTADLEEARRKRDEVLRNWNRKEAYAQ